MDFDEIFAQLPKCVDVVPLLSEEDELGPKVRRSHSFGFRNSAYTMCACQEVLQIMRQKNLKVLHVARESGVHPQQLARWLRGRTLIPLLS